jgi:hypothetical protein
MPAYLSLAAVQLLKTLANYLCFGKRAYKCLVFAEENASISVKEKTMLQQFAQTYSYSFQNTNTNSSLSGGVIAAIVIASLILAIFFIIVMWRVFKKAGRPGWAAIIPIYNTWVLFEISGKPGWWVLLSFIPFVGSLVLLVLYIIAMLELAKRFSKSTVFAVFGLIIFSFIGFIMLAFGDAKYKGDVVATTGTPPAPAAPTAPAPQVPPAPVV